MIDLQRVHALLAVEVAVGNHWLVWIQWQVLGQSQSQMGK